MGKVFWGGRKTSGGETLRVEGVGSGGRLDTSESPAGVREGVGEGFPVPRLK